MKISGCTFVRNGFLLGYPVKESLHSLLTICDEVVIAIGNSEDETLSYVQSLQDPRIIIIETEWDDTLREGGQILAQQTNIALNACTGDWVIYLQADEVLNESEYEQIKQDMHKADSRSDIDGLLFSYHHFFGNYDYVGIGRQWYRKEIRAFKRNANIISWRDAQGFRIRLQEQDFRKLRVQECDAHIYHYGWVRNPSAYVKKQAAFGRLYHDDAWLEVNLPKSEEFPICYEVQLFDGKHPKIMENKIVLDSTWTSLFDPSRRKPRPFAVACCDAIERLTGKRIFEYRNYVLVK
ncbi:MAG: glycosyltransferase [Bacteroidetes bacterium]|nr:glycosyltransferase [bacterium]NBP64274.1 glycosyltransferase [Bacteroidota bacterium]